MGGSHFAIFQRFSAHNWFENLHGEQREEETRSFSSPDVKAHAFRPHRRKPCKLDMTPPSADGKRPAGDAPKSGAAAPTAELAHQQQLLLQQQLQQQQLQLLQLQQQQLQNLSPSDLTAMTQQLALFMMPMMPFMMPLQQQQAVADATAVATSTPTSSAAPNFQATADALGLSAPGTEGFGLLNASFGALGPPPNTEDPPKRKRGRPPKKDVVARAKADAEKTLKQQFPMWGYGLPMPLLPGFPGMLPSGLNVPGVAAKDQTALPSVDEQGVKEDEADAGYDKTGGDVSGRPAKMAKKKPRGTGKPRGRPRTRPRPGEIIHRAKPAAIAPANYSVMYNYSLSNLAQKSSDAAAGAAAAGTHDDSRLAPLGASLLSGDHE